jgi:hypothetical protein
MGSVSSILAWAVPLGIAAVFGWFKKKASDHTKAIEALEAGVLTAWEQFGRDKKQALREKEGSSKFSTEDKEKLRGIAKTTAASVLSGQGLNLESLIKSSELQDLAIKKIVDKIKS